MDRVPGLLSLAAVLAGCTTSYVGAGLGSVGGDTARTTGTGEASVDRALVCDYLTIVSGGKFVQWRLDMGSARFEHLRVTDLGTGDTTDLGEWRFWWFNPAAVQVSWPVRQGIMLYAYGTQIGDLIDGELYHARADEADGVPDFTNHCWRWGVGVNHRPKGQGRFFWSVEYRWLKWQVEYWDYLHTNGIVFQIGVRSAP